MKLFALLTPALMLALLWALHRLEVWMGSPAGSRGSSRPRMVGRSRAPARRRRAGARS